MKKPQIIVLTAIFLMGCCTPCSARIQTFKTSSIEVLGSFRSGIYLSHKGEVTGELDVTEAIPGLAEADMDGDGVVQYRTNFTLSYPKNPAQSNGTLIFDVENRGRPTAFYLYNTYQASSQKGDTLVTGFLQDRGFMHVIASWELGQGVTLPAFMDGEGKTRYVEGAGFAVVRDLVAFLKFAEKDTSGHSNPLAATVRHAIGVGYSQTARFLKTFLLHGFNTAMGKRIFDGMHLQAGHSGLLPILTCGRGPKSSGNMFPTFLQPDMPGVHEPPFTYAAICAVVRKKGARPPLMIVTNMTSDYYSLRASLARTGLAGTDDVPIPPNVRIYDVAGSAHMIIDAPGCKLARGRLDWHPVMRAVLLHLYGWVKTGNLPPESKLMPLVSQPGNPLVLGPPHLITQAVIMVPKTDQDGNDTGGVRLPDLQVPLGTFAGQNEPLKNILCTFSGAYIPFKTTLKKRRESGDRRLSLEERYKDKDDYTRKISAAADEIVKQGFMLEEDTAMVIKAAVRSDLF